MTFDRGLIQNYEMVLLGNEKNISSHFFRYQDEYNEKMALQVFKHTIEYYLRWTPEKTAESLNYNVIELMKLDGILKYLRFPPEVDIKKDFFYIAHMLYPYKIKFNQKKLMLEVYKKVLRRELIKFPKEFMTGSIGVVRACVCFQYMMEQYLHFSSIESAYRFFYSPNGAKALRKYRLFSVCRDMFESPVEFLHKSLPDGQKDEFLYNYYSFKLINEKEKKELAKALS